MKTALRFAAIVGLLLHVELVRQRLAAEPSRACRTGSLQRRLDDARQRRRRLDAAGQRPGRHQPLGRSRRRSAFLHLPHRFAQRNLAAAESRRGPRLALAQSVRGRLAVQAGTPPARRPLRNHGGRRREEGDAVGVRRRRSAGGACRRRVGLAGVGQGHDRELAHASGTSLPSGEESLSAWTVRDAPFELAEAADVFPGDLGRRGGVVSSQRDVGGSGDAQASRAWMRRPTRCATRCCIARSADGLPRRDSRPSDDRSLETPSPVKSFAVRVAVPCEQTPDAKTWLDMAKKLSDDRPTPRMPCGERRRGGRRFGDAPGSSSAATSS